MNVLTERTCPDCQGTGAWMKPDDCTTCRGTETISADEWKIRHLGQISVMSMRVQEKRDQVAQLEGEIAADLEILRQLRAGLAAAGE